MLYEPVDARALEAQSASFVDLLVRTVDDGAGIGFLAPLGPAQAESYWAGVAREVEEGHRILLAARDGPRLAGSVQVELARRETGPHRAEVQKLMVDPRARRQGIAKALMERAERAARERGRTLLMLDTFEGSVADGMYRRWGWTVVGTIPSYAISPQGDLRRLVLFYKETGAHERALLARRA
jgi:ribosomal protein S18 acetylase RimI-like enzyme